MWILKLLCNGALEMTLFSFTACKETQLRQFPADRIFEVVEVKSCVTYPIVSFDPLKFGSGVEGPCPAQIFGFASKDIGPIMTWIRDAQTMAKEKCN